MIAFHRCRGCGVLTHWAHIDGNSGDLGVNMRNCDPSDLLGILEYDGSLSTK
jgi:hypothetical protein